MSCVFFFFKQKTAYEMRISDWSSDVCSSDLADAVPLAGDELSDLQIIDLRTEFNNLTAELVAEDQRGVHRLGGPPIPFIDVNEIGRASCRERVCQYV